MLNLGVIEQVSLREIWNDEAHDFTPWLASESGLGVLGEILGFELELVLTESAVGSYRADILAKLIEQDESTNHVHLGKIITFAAGHKVVTLV